MRIVAFETRTLRHGSVNRSGLRDSSCHPFMTGETEFTASAVGQRELRPHVRGMPGAAALVARLAPAVHERRVTDFSVLKGPVTWTFPASAFGSRLYRRHRQHEEDDGAAQEYTYCFHRHIRACGRAAVKSPPRRFMYNHSPVPGITPQSRREKRIDILT